MTWNWIYLVLYFLAALCVPCGAFFGTYSMALYCISPLYSTVWHGTDQEEFYTLIYCIFFKTFLYKHLQTNLPCDGIYENTRSVGNVETYMAGTLQLLCLTMYHCFCLTLSKARLCFYHALSSSPAPEPQACDAVHG